MHAFLWLSRLTITPLAPWSPPNRAFDTRGRRRLSLPEFQRLHEFLLNIQNSFSYFDADRNRTLQTNEVQQALQHAGGGGGLGVVLHSFGGTSPQHSPSRLHAPLHRTLHQS